jgi:hypothetical protein
MIFFFVSIVLTFPFQSLIAIEEIMIQNGLIGNIVFVEENGLNEFIHALFHFLFVHRHLARIMDRKGSRVSNPIEVVSIWIEAEKDRRARSEIRIEVHHTLLFAHIVGVTELVDFHDEDMGAEIDEDIRAVAGTAAFYRLVAAKGEGILEVGLERVHHVMLFEAEAAGDGVVGVEDAVTAETMGLPAGGIGYIYVLTV